MAGTRAHSYLIKYIVYIHVQHNKILRYSYGGDVPHSSGCAKDVRFALCVRCHGVPRKCCLPYPDIRMPAYIIRTVSYVFRTGVRYSYDEPYLIRTLPYLCCLPEYSYAIVLSSYARTNPYAISYAADICMASY
jgi:hypothetical protein